jgi:hypothetical protein
MAPWWDWTAYYRWRKKVPSYIAWKKENLRAMQERDAARERQASERPLDAGLRENRGDGGR